MQISIQSSPLYSDLLGDEELALILHASTEFRTFIDVELALANAQSALGLIPQTAGADMKVALAKVSPDSVALGKGISTSGVPVPALLAELRKVLPPELAQWLHWGATSQDIVDTTMMLQTAQCLTLLDDRLSRLLNTLHKQSNAHATTLMAARTRTQLATPITLGLRVAQWAQPLIALEKELSLLTPRVLRIQFGGAAGANSVVAPYGPAIAEHMASALNLSNSPPWHTDRSGIVGLANWLLQICLSLSKLAKDLLIMSRSDIAEVHAGQSGGSSTMPQKANPVQSEMVVTMGTIAQAIHAGICAAASPVEERDGASWTVEWILLPQLLITTGCALRHCLSLAESLTVNTQRMHATVNESSQLMAEAASFALAEHMPRTEAQDLVKLALASSRPLHRALAESCNVDIDWHTALDPQAVYAPCKQISQSIFAARTAWPAAVQ